MTIYIIGAAFTLLVNAAGVASNHLFWHVAWRLRLTVMAVVLVDALAWPLSVATDVFCAARAQLPEGR